VNVVTEWLVVHHSKKREEEVEVHGDVVETVRAARIDGGEMTVPDVTMDLDVMPAPGETTDPDVMMDLDGTVVVVVVIAGETENLVLVVVVVVGAIENRPGNHSVKREEVEVHGDVVGMIEDLVMTVDLGMIVDLVKTVDLGMIEDPVMTVDLVRIVDLLLVRTEMHGEEGKMMDGLL